MTRLVVLALLVSMLSPCFVFAVEPKGVTYFGGTVDTFIDATRPVDGRMDIRDANILVFTGNYKPFKGARLSIPYTSIVDLEYGQKAGRRVGAAIGSAVLLGPLGLFVLFSKKRKHYLTVGYMDADGKAQAAVFEFGKDVIRQVLTVVETRSGKKIEYQDDEARKSGKGGA
jgi:hypothetical protein